MTELRMSGYTLASVVIYDQAAQARPAWPGVGVVITPEGQWSGVIARIGHVTRDGRIITDLSIPVRRPDRVPLLWLPEEGGISAPYASVGGVTWTTTMPDGSVVAAGHLDRDAEPGLYRVGIDIVRGGVN